MDLLTTARVVISLAVVLGVIWFLSRRFRGNVAAQRARARVQVLGKTGIAPKASVVIVETEGVRLVLGVTEHGVSVLHSVDAPAEAPAPASAPARPAAPAPAPAPAPRSRFPGERDAGGPGNRDLGAVGQAALDPNAAALAPQFRSRDRAARAAAHPTFSAALAAQFKALIPK